MAKRTKTYLISVTTTSKSDVGLKIAQEAVKGIVYAADTQYKCQSAIAHRFDCTMDEALDALESGGIAPVEDINEVIKEDMKPHSL